MTDVIVCKKCDGTGWVMKTAKSGRGQRAVRCPCVAESRARALSETADIPARYRHCTLENYKPMEDSQKDALKIAKLFVKNYPVQDIGILFLGPCGVGKTHLAVGIIRELIERKKVHCRFTDFRELMRNIQGTFTAESPASESDILAPVFAADVLVLDELGAGRTSAWAEDTVFYIINRRYNHKKLTIFTSNYPDSGDAEDTRNPYFKKEGDTLVDRIGVRLRSRIYEMCKVVEVGGKDFRKEIKQGGYRF